jgi:hypothetical protein
VAEVTGNDTVILNIGMNHRVKRGMRFVVYAEAQHILDAHGNDLGALEIPKSEVEVIDVQEKLSIAKSDVIEIPMESILTVQRAMRMRRELPVDKDQITKIEVDLRIRKGDKVRQVP